jgi:hypothetical protein
MLCRRCVLRQRRGLANRVGLLVRARGGLRGLCCIGVLQEACVSSVGAL